jgi:hypothetical protein
MSMQGKIITFTYFPTHRWKGGRNIKLEGSDHAPVLIRLLEIPDISQHSTPTLSARYIPMIRGLQQTLGTTFFSFVGLWCFFKKNKIIRYFHFIQLIMSSLTSGCDLFWASLRFEEASGHLLG